MTNELPVIIAYSLSRALYFSSLFTVVL